MPNKMTRKEQHDAVKTNMKDWVLEAREKNITISQLLNTMSPEKDDERQPDEALQTLMQNDGLRMRSTRNFPASELKDFYQVGKDYRKELLYGYMDDEYDRCFDTPRIQTRAGVDMQSLPLNEYWRDFTDAPAREEKKIAPPIRLNDIVAFTQNIPGVDFRIPEYELLEEDEQMVDVSEGTTIPIATLKLGRRTVTLKKIALGLRWTYEFARNAPMRADGIRRWVQRVATRHEMALVKEGIMTILEGLTHIDFPGNGDFTAAGGAGTTSWHDNPGYALANHILLHLQLDDPYQVDTILGGKNSIIRYLLTDSVNYSLNEFAQRNPQFSPRARLLNQLGTTEAVGVLKDDSYTELTDGTHDDNRMLLFDSATTLAYLRQTGSQTDEIDQDPSQQIVTRYLSRIYGFYIEDDNARFLANMTA
jgi:hypothetical protein